MDTAGSAAFGEQDPDGIAGEVAVARALVGPLRAAGTGVLVDAASTAAFPGTPRMAVPRHAAGRRLGAVPAHGGAVLPHRGASSLTAGVREDAPGSGHRIPAGRRQGRRRTRRSQTQRAGTSIGPGATTAGRGGAPVAYSVLITNS